MTSDREAKSMGYVDRVHYKHYPHLTTEGYLKEVCGGKSNMNNEGKMMEYVGNLCSRIGGINDEISPYMNSEINIQEMLDLIESHKQELYEMAGAVKAAKIIATRYQNNYDYLLKGISYHTIFLNL